MSRRPAALAAFALLAALLAVLFSGPAWAGPVTTLLAAPGIV